MELRVLGAHNLESKDTRMESHLIDGVLVLDTGSLTRSLTFAEQMKIRAIILSHRHFDHVRDLPSFGLALRETGVTVDIYAIRDTLDFVRDKLLDGSLYPNFLETPSLENPTFRLNAVDFYHEFNVLDYTVMAVPVPHSVPAAGFQLSSKSTTLFYTGDAGKGLDKAWTHVSPDVLLTEVTFSNEHEARAIEVGHLTPALLAETLNAFKEKRDYLPRVVVTHMNPLWETAVRQELGTISQQLGIDILISHADMTLQL